MPIHVRERVPSLRQPGQRLQLQWRMWKNWVGIAGDLPLGWQDQPEPWINTQQERTHTHMVICGGRTRGPEERLAHRQTAEALTCHITLQPVCLSLTHSHWLAYKPNISPKSCFRSNSSQLIHTKPGDTEGMLLLLCGISSLCVFLYTLTCVFEFPTSGRELLGVDDFGGILLSRGDLHTSPDHGESASERKTHTDICDIETSHVVSHRCVRAMQEAQASGRPRTSIKLHKRLAAVALQLQCSHQPTQTTPTALSTSDH